MNLLTLVACALLSGEAVTVSSLLEEMVDLQRWSRLPDPQYRAFQTSGSVPPVVDAGSPELLLLERSGPGMIGRVCLAGIDAGTIRVYVDRSSEPILAGTVEHWRRGGVVPIDTSFVRSFDRRWEWEYPIPFADGCRVTLEVTEGSLGPGSSFQIAGRTYEPPVEVESFSAPAVERAKETQRRVAGILEGEPTPGPSPAWDLRFPLRLTSEHPSAEIQLPKGQGGAINELRLRAPSAEPEVLRQLILAISFDGHTTVRAPLMELFGTVAGGGAYRALASEITDAGELVLRCPMPFVQRAEISLEGAGESPPVSVGRQEKRGPLRRLLRPREGKKSNLVEPIVAPPEGLAVEGYALVGPYRWDQRSLYFHASWRQTPSLRGVRATTWESGASSGRGVFVGSTLVASSPNSDWWGQGAERWVVDSSGPEVLLGTSVVDHFGVTEQPVEPARGGLRGMARGGGPGSFGHTALFRWRTLDAIPFASGCRFDWHFDPATHLLPLPAGAVCYWYADAWSAVSIPRLSREQVSWPTLPERRVPRIARAIEGEDLEVVHFDGEEPRTSSRIHDEAVGPWSGDADLNWRGLTPGRELVLSFEAPTPGRYRIKGYFSQGVDFGIHRLWVNDRPAGDPMDFFRAELGRTPAVDLGEFDLGAKGNRLSVRVISTSKIASPKSCRFGLDALVLTPVHAGDLSQLGAEPDHRE